MEREQMSFSQIQESMTWMEGCGWFDAIHKNDVIFRSIVYYIEKRCFSESFICLRDVRTPLRISGVGES